MTDLGLPKIFNAEIVRAIRLGMLAGHMRRRAVGRDTRRGAARVNQRNRDSQRRMLAMVREDMRIDRARDHARNIKEGSIT